MRKDSNTPIFNKMVNLGLMTFIKEGVKIPKDGYYLTLIDKYTKRGIWRIYLASDKTICKYPFIWAVFYGENCQINSKTLELKGFK